MTNEEGFWKTMDLLVGKEWRRTGKELMDDVQDWVEKIVAKREFSVFSEDDGYFTPGDGCSCSSSWGESESKEKKVREFFETLDILKVECNFSHPQAKSRLEELMGSNLVCLTDRDYMQKLQSRILENYAESMEKRIQTREADEMERIKNLVLTGKIPMREAPPEMANHPAFITENYCKNNAKEKRAKVDLSKVHILTFLCWDEAPVLTVENRSPYCLTAENFSAEACEVDCQNDCTPSHEEGDLFKFETPIIRALKNSESIEEMYELADEIIGILKFVAETPALAEDSFMT